MNKTFFSLTSYALCLLLLPLLLLTGCGSTCADIGTETEWEAKSESETGTKAETDTETGAQDTESINTEIGTDTDTTAEADTGIPSSEHAAPRFPLGLYAEEGKNRFTRIDGYEFAFPQSDSDAKWKKDTWTYKGKTNLICDITYFTLIPSTERELRLSGWDSTWKELWDSTYGASPKAKIGYELNVSLKNGECFRFSVLSPSDTFRREEYFELYLYDDLAHAKDSRYSHVTERDVNADTLYTSVKITLRNRCYEIDGIRLTAFVYTSPSDFDAQGFYIGSEKTDITVLPKEH